MRIFATAYQQFCESNMTAYLQLLRPLQWMKNAFVFAPAFFSNNLLDMHYLLPSAGAFAAFCFLSSSIYCFNDLKDIESDRLHPKKCRRPIASGAVSRRGGYLMMMLCLLIGFVILALTKTEEKGLLLLLLAVYWLMNIAYCIRLKQIAILDVSIIAVGFVMRVLAGGLATGIWISQWLVLMTFLLTLFLALTKRSDDYRIYKETGQKMRENITSYNHAYINEITGILASVTMVCYIMYTMSPEVTARMQSDKLYLTSGWVLLALCRYLQNMLVFQKGGSPTRLVVKDHFLQFCIVGWIVTFFCIIYL